MGEVFGISFAVLLVLFLIYWLPVIWVLASNRTDHNAFLLVGRADRILAPHTGRWVQAERVFVRQGWLTKSWDLTGPRVGPFLCALDGWWEAMTGFTSRT
jgi:hypothetical protein